MDCFNVTNYLYRFNNILQEMACKMLAACPTNSITLDFITCMVPHHRAAIYMCENLLKYTMYEPLKEIANDIIKMQEKGIKEMLEVANTTDYLQSLKSDIFTYQNMYLGITRNMIYKMKSAPICNNIDLNFTNEMIPHHEGAVKMCENLLKYKIDPRLETIAKNIIMEQSEGIKKLEKIKKELCLGI